MSTFFSKENSWYFAKEIGILPTRINTAHIMTNSPPLLGAFWRSFCSCLTTVFRTATVSKINSLQLVLQDTIAIAKKVVAVAGILIKNIGGTVVGMEPQIGKV